MRKLSSLLDLGFQTSHVYFNAAKSAYDQADQSYQIVAKYHSNSGPLWLVELDDIGEEIDLSAAGIPAPAEVTNAAEIAFSHYMHSLCVCHVMCAMALEAHINFVAREKLSDSDFISFERMKTEDKWATLPAMLQKSKFDKGKEPFQSFARLVDLRNGLVHSKVKYFHEHLAQNGGPQVVMDKGLQSAKKSLETTRQMIGLLAQLLEIMLPDWIDNPDLLVVKVSAPDWEA